MPTTSALQAVPVPTTGDAPLIPSNMMSHVQYMEKRLVMRFTDASQRDAVIPAGTRENGMVAYLTSTKLFTYYDGAVWTNLVASLANPTAAPVDGVNSGGQFTYLGAGSNKAWGIKNQGGTLVFRYDFEGSAADVLTLSQTAVTIANGKTFSRDGVNQPVLRSGSGAPNNAVGVDGDWYAQWT